MKHIVVYVHGKGGSPAEAEHYKSLFPDSEVLITVHRPRGRPKKNSRRFSLPCASAAAASR